MPAVRQPPLDWSSRWPDVRPRIVPRRGTPRSDMPTLISDRRPPTSRPQPRRSAGRAWRTSSPRTSGRSRRRSGTRASPWPTSSARRASPRLRPSARSGSTPSETRGGPPARTEQEDVAADMALGLSTPTARRRQPRLLPPPRRRDLRPAARTTSTATSSTGPTRITPARSWPSPATTTARPSTGTDDRPPRRLPRQLLPRPRPRSRRSPRARGHLPPDDDRAGGLTGSSTPRSSRSSASTPTSPTGPGFLTGANGDDSQTKWLLATLKKIKARPRRRPTSRKALIVAVHHPPYSNGGHCRQSRRSWPRSTPPPTPPGSWPTSSSPATPTTTRGTPATINFQGRPMEIPFLVAGCGGHNDQRRRRGVRPGDRRHGPYDKSLRGLRLPRRPRHARRR